MTKAEAGTDVSQGALGTATLNEKGLERTLPQDPRRSMFPADALISDFQPPEPRENRSVLSKATLLLVILQPRKRTHLNPFPPSN